MIILFLPLLLLLALITPTAATFVACITAAAVPSTATQVAIPDPTQNTSDGCGTICQKAGYTYSFWQPLTCKCGNTEPALNSNTMTYTTGDPMAGLPQRDCDASSFNVHYLATRYGWNSCYDVVRFDNQLSTLQNTVADCFAHCASLSPPSLYMAFGATAFAPPSISCLCSSGTSPPTTFINRVACGFGAVSYFYVPPDLPVGSATVRKRQRQLVAAAQAEQSEQLCPRGYSACSIGKGADAYECLEVDQELESCGGCMNGYHGKTNGTVGIDCTALRGVALPAGVMCHAGACKVLRCDDGFHISNSQCMPLSLLRQQRSWALGAEVTPERG